LPCNLMILFFFINIIITSIYFKVKIVISKMFLNPLIFVKAMKHILKCEKCGKYTLKEKCECGGKSFIARPPKYSPEDKYGKYRRQVKKPELEKKGLI